MSQRRPWSAVVRGGAAMCLAAVLLAGCDSMREPDAPPPAAPAPTFTGPRHLHGTIASVASLRGFEPQYVSGYGLVVGLKGKGANGAPPFLRQWLINEMKKGGLGSLRFDTQNLTPDLVLANGDAASVVIEGFIPPGAVKNTRFDVMVSALDGTTTESLRDGMLWTFDLSENGANPQLRFSTPIAKASGPTYIDPFEDPSIPKLSGKFERSAVVLSGGITTVSRPLELMLNQPSYNRARLISDRINERFPRTPRVDREDVANPISDSLIQIRVPSAYAREPDRLLRLISKLYVQRGPGFEEQKAEQMASLIVSDGRYADDVTMVWEALGRQALPVIRRYYAHDRLDVRFAALDAGTKLGDDVTLGDEVNRGRLIDLSAHADPDVRRRVAYLLSYLPGNLRASSTLKRLLNDNDKTVRIAAYEAMAESGDTTLSRLPFADAGRTKFILDVVPSDKPMVYVTQQHVPRIAVFGQLTAFNAPMLAQLWDNRLMIRQNAAGEPIDVYYQAPNETAGKTVPIKAPSLAALVFLLAHNPPSGSEQLGFNFSYSQVVNVLYLLEKQGALPCSVELQLNPFASLIARAREDTGATFRPETTGTAGGDNGKGRPDTDGSRPATDGKAPGSATPTDPTRPPVSLP